MQHVYWLREWLAGIGLLLGAALTAQAQCPAAASCTPSPASAPSAAAFGMGIFNVTLGTINNTTAGVTDGYQDYGCTTGTTLSPGASYPISIRTNANADENVRVWLDLNNDGQFNPATELLFSSNSARLHTGTTAVIPATAVLGQPLRLRVAADAATSPIPTPCSTPQYSQTEDYRVTLQVNTQKPVPAFAVGAAGACAGTYTFQDQSTQGPTSWRWSFGDGTFSTQQHPSHTYAQPGTYDVRLRVCNTNGCDSLLKTGVLQFYGTNPAPASCQPATTSYCCGYGITRFEFGTLSQVSADASVGYEDFTCTRRLSVRQAEAVPFKVTTSTNAQNTWLYVDANNDGTFSATELVYTALNQTNPEGFFVVPEGAVLGQPLRLRVVSDDASSAAGACAARTRGQVEDYSLVVTPAPCAAPLLPGRIAYLNSATSHPTRRMYAFMLTEYTPNTFVQWQRSALASPGWQDIPGATAPVYYASDLQSSPQSYRAVTRCGASTAVSPGIDAWYSGASFFHTSCNTNYISEVRLAGTSLHTVTACSNADGGAYSFFDPTKPSQTATLQAGETYELFVTTTQSCRLQVFVGKLVDNGTTAYPRQLVATTAGVPTRVVFTLDTTLVNAHALRLRLRCDKDTQLDNQVSDTGQLLNGETEDYLLRVARTFCVTPITAGTVTASVARACPTVPVDLRVANYTYGGRLQWQSSPDSLTWQDVAGQTARAYRPLVRSTTYFRLKLLNCGAVAYSAAVKVAAQPYLECYCTATLTPAATGPLLTRVRVVGTTLDNSSPAAPGGPGLTQYAPTVPTQTATLVRGATYALDLTVANPGASASTLLQAAAWLDYDHNGRYDSLEYVPLTRVTATAATTTYRVLLPVDQAAPAGPLGLRLRVSNNFALGRLNACTPVSAGAGETEDYVVTIETPCAAALTAGTVSYLTNPSFRGLLQSIGATFGAALQWQLSANNQTWADVPGANQDQLALRYPWAPAVYMYYFRLRATCNGTTVYSASVQLPPNYGQFAACTNWYTGDGCRAAYVDDVELGTALANLGTGCAIYGQAFWLPTMPGCTATLVRGRSYPLRLAAVGDASFTQGVTVGGWVDWNQDGVLAASEFYGAPPASIGRVTYTATVAVPATAPLGLTQLYVRAGGAAYVNANSGCVTTIGHLSEWEEYLLKVVDQPGPELPTLVASLCAGAPLQLQATGAGAGATFTWLGPNGFQATGDLVSRPGFTAADAGTYVAVAELNGQRIATSLYVPPTPACVPLAARPASVASALSIFPNPTTGLCTLRVPAGGPRPTRLRLHTATGQLVHEQAVTSRSTADAQEVPLDLRRLPRGLYFVELQTGQGSQYGKVVVE